MSENAFPRKRIYRRRSSMVETKKSPSAPRGLTPEDLEAFQDLSHRLSPQGREVITLMLKVFTDKGELDTEQLMKLISIYAGQTKHSSLAPLLNILPFLVSPSQGGQSPSTNPALLASLLGMLIPRAK